MIKKNKKDVLEIFNRLKKILAAKPPIQAMVSEVRMMKFKVKPIAGDVSFLQLNNKHLIETLWSLGKLDETFHKEFRYINADQREVFFRIFDDLYQQFQNQLNKVNIKSELKTNLPQLLELEIFKELPTNKRSN